MKRIMLAAAGMAVYLACGAANATVFTGSAVGQWLNPVLEADAVYSIANNDVGGGVAKVAWGDPPPGDNQSYLTFDGAGSDANLVPPQWSSVNSPFLLGNLTYHNGIQYVGTGLDGVDLKCTVTILNPSLPGTDVGTFDFNIDNTPNPSGDIIGTSGTPAPLSFSDGVNTYQFNWFGLSADGGVTMLSSLSLAEGCTTSVGIYGSISEVAGQATPVPDASSTVLLLGGVLIALDGIRRKVSRK